MIYDYLMNGNKRFGINLIDLCRSRLGCEPNEINKNVILAPWWKPEIFEEHVNSINLLSDMRNETWNLDIGNKKITYIRTGIGAPVITDIVMALSFTPCKKIILIGAIGGLKEELKIGDFIVPKYSVCGNGVCRYLTDEKIANSDCFGRKYYPNKDIYNNIISVIKNVSEETKIDWYDGICFSVDTIIAELAHMDEIIGMGCDCIEMETAALFKASEICNIKAGAILNISDNPIKNKSLFSGRTDDEMEERKIIIKSILPKIVIQSF